MSERSNTVADRRVHPATVPLRFAKDAPSTLLALPAGYAFLSDNGLREAIGFALLIAAAAMLLQWLAWRSFRYGIGEDELVIESGILLRRRRSIPFERIQDVDIERGPVARLFGLAKLRVETGGSGSDEGVLDSVTLAEAERLRAALRTTPRAAAPPGAVVAAEEPPQAELLFSLSRGRLFASGITNFSMVYLAGLFAILQAFEGWIPFDIYDPGRAIGLVEGQLEGRWGIGPLVAVGLLALLLGVVTGLARTVERDWGFQLTRQPLGLRRSRGLLTRTEMLFPPRRIQLSVLTTGPLRNLFGLSQLDLQTLAATGNAAERQVAAPLADRSEIARILDAAGSMRLPVTALARGSRLHLVRIGARLLLILLVIVAAALVMPVAALAFAALPLVALAEYLRWRMHRHGIEDGALHVRHGIWRQRSWIVPIHRLQSLRLSRSWLQRRLGLATLVVDTAGAPFLDPVRIRDLREPVALALVVSLLQARTVTSERSTLASSIACANRSLLK